jgi:putative hydrolase of the HAD superfamily
MRDIAAVVFDLDDTLYRERRFVLSGLRAVAHAIETSHGVPARQVFRCLQGRFRRAGREDLLQTCCRAMGLPVREVPGWVALIRAHRPQLRLPRETATVLRTLRRRGYRLGILTNGLVDTQAAKVRALGLEALVDAVVYADGQAPGGKPHGACFDAIRAALDVPASRCVHVGDHGVNDVDGARAAGMRAVWLSRTDKPHQTADAVIATIAEVPGVLDALEERHARAC